jgi:phosphatidylinositol alpha-1,6-mannosyltransferase
MPLVCIANSRGRSALPVFFIVTFIRLLFSMRRGDILMLGDGVLAPMGWALKLLRKVPVIIVVHGLDVTYSPKFYQWIWVRFCLARLDAVVAVSNATREEALSRGVIPSRICVIPNGVEQSFYKPSAVSVSQRSLIAGVSVEGRTVLLTVGRLVKRKGVAWFIDGIISGLGEEYLYVVAGDGVERSAIEATILAKGLQDRVIVLGGITENEKIDLLHMTDYFIQPNINVAGDMEGFGISVIEASACGVMVVAADMQGLKDSVINGVTGDLLPSGDALVWRQYFLDNPRPRLKPSLVAEATKDRFSWSAVSEKYALVVEAIRLG